MDKKKEERKKDTRKAIILRFNNREWEILEECLKSLGSKKTEFFKELMKHKHSKMFPYYKVHRKLLTQQPEEEMTLEQKCEFIGGRIVKESYGNKICRIQYHENKFSESHEDLPLQHDLLDQYVKNKKNTQ